MDHPEQPSSLIHAMEGERERMLKMVQQEYIRYLYFREGLSIREINRRTGHHRETIRRYLEGPDFVRTQGTPAVPCSRTISGCHR